MQVKCSYNIYVNGFAKPVSVKDRLCLCQFVVLLNSRLTTMPLDTILCLDSSGSMQGKGMTELKNAVKVFLDGK